MVVQAPTSAITSSNYYLDQRPSEGEENMLSQQFRDHTSQREVVMEQNRHPLPLATQFS